MAGKISDITATVTAPAAGMLIEVEKSDGSSAKLDINNASGLALISKVTTSGSQSNVTFSSIASTYTDLIISINGRCSKAALNDDVLVQLNADTGANYDQVHIQVNNVTVNAANALAGSSWNLGWLPGTTATANVSSSLDIIIQNYASTTFQRTMRARAMLNQSNTAATLYAKEVSGWYRSTTAVSSVKVFPATSNFIDGSVVALYGRV